jgi:hypothetical protein
VFKAGTVGFQSYLLPGENRLAGIFQFQRIPQLALQEFT